MSKSDDQRIMYCSYSSASFWERGDRDTAIAMIQGRKTESNFYMERGKIFHKKLEEESKKTKAMPTIWDYPTIVESQGVEKFFELELDKDLPWLKWRGVIDFVGKNMLVDHKFSSGAMSGYLNSHQLPLYALAVKRKWGVINLKNPNTGEVSIGVRYLTTQTVENAREWATTIACDIRAHCESSNIRWWRKSNPQQKLVKSD